MNRCSGLAMLLLVGAFSAPTGAMGQNNPHAFGTGVQFQSFTFDEGLGASVANLTLIPMAYTLPMGDVFTVDFYGAYAMGAVEKENADGVAETFELIGMVDTRLRASLQVAPWAVFTAAVTIPTGNSAHDNNEAAVASVLSTDILGFREANWGTGAAVTGGLATAYQGGKWGLGLGASYRYSNGFKPTDGVDLTYQPGNEIRVRVGVDRNVGEGGKFTAGFTWQNYSEDLYDDRNLFKAGSRFRGDMSMAFRTGRATWALYAANVWREQGDAFLDLVDAAGTVVGDTTVTVGHQNLLVAGLSGSAPLGSVLRIRPALEFRYQTREEEDGEGWIAGAGADIPLRFFGAMDAFPRGKFYWGQLMAPTGEKVSLWGVEAGVTLRWRF
ncbi:hypothetical protein ACFL5A_02770 [Gemmatimonadota bacterium]